MDSLLLCNYKRTIFWKKYKRLKTELDRHQMSYPLSTGWRKRAQGSASPPSTSHLVCGWTPGGFTIQHHSILPNPVRRNFLKFVS
ncbi:hypothetical protein GE061_000648 [Apolygus lucorum]|uniref:Uncharacterized protein n=1 Tax=Apolygus lucorum TaxID=248454 RepID=A0A8S9Y718_APOLU|nr:hypothetical protein GE061_000648 [Apolygus lucorum]